jgi:multiple sugar transport system substrate-binding protein
MGGKTVKTKKLNQQISRREILRLMALGGAGAVATACGAAATPQIVTETVKETVEVEKVVKETVQVEVEKIVEVEKVVTPTAEGMIQYGGSLEAILRRSFIPQMNAIQENQMAQWGKEHNVEVMVSSPGEWREMIAAGIESKTGDIGETFQEEALIYGNALADVSDICEELGSKYGGWYELAQRVGKDKNGVWRTIPRAFTAHLLNYRTDYFGEVGYPEGCKTYDDYLDAATKLKEAGLPLVANTVSQTGPNDSASWTYSVLWSHGGSEVDEAGKVAINSEGTRKALTYMKALAEVSSPNITGYDEGANNRAFLGGEISATQNATSIYYNATGDVLANMNHMRYPEGPAGWIMFTEMNTLSLFEHSKNLEAGKALLKWLMEPEQLIPLTQIGITFYTPLLKTYDDMPSMPWNVDPKLSVAKGLAHGGNVTGYPLPPSAKSAKAYQNRTIVNMFARVITNDASIDEAIKAAEEDLKSIYES